MVGAQIQETVRPNYKHTSSSLLLLWSRDWWSTFCMWSSVQLHLTWESQGIWWEERVRILTDFITSCGPVVQWVACHLSGFSVGEKRGKDLDYHNSPLSWLGLGGQGEDVRLCISKMCLCVQKAGSEPNWKVRILWGFCAMIMSICSGIWRWLNIAKCQFTILHCTVLQIICV